MELFSGERAFEHVRYQVSLGPRPPGSEASATLRDYVRDQLPGWTFEEQVFVPLTPRGPIVMTNLIGRWPAGPLPGEDAIVLGAHADTKVFDEFEFLGANDGGSGVACLLELGRVIPEMALKTPVVLAFLDGEEAQVEWGGGDGLYGSRWLAQSWQSFLKQIRAVLILDIVGDRELVVTRDLYSTEWLQDLVWEVAREQGLEEVFDGPLEHIQDDHLPFLVNKVPSLVVIGFGHDARGDYFPPYWHTPEDTLDKVSALSLQRVGRVVQAALPRLRREARRSA